MTPARQELARRLAILNRLDAASAIAGTVIAVVMVILRYV